MTEDVSKPATVEELPTYYDALEGLLNQVHLNTDMIQKVLRNYIKRPQEFEETPMRLMVYLQALGVRPTAASFVASNFWSMTKNINLDMVQSMMGVNIQPSYNYGAAAFPQVQSPQQYPVPYNPPEDSEMKMMRWMMMMKMFNQQPQTPSFDPSQMIMMQMMMGGGGRWEPVYDKTGNPVVDQMGKPVMNFTMLPAQQHPTQPAGPDPTIELFKEMFRGQNEVIRAADTRYFQSLEKQREIEGEIQDKESKALRRRLAMIEQERGSDRLLEDVERLKKLGLYPTNSTHQDIEATKLDTDLQRWKYERETDMQRWQSQQQMEARKWFKEREIEEERERRTQERLGMLGESLKNTIQTVVTPIVSSMSAGVAQGIQGAKSESQPDLSTYNDEALMKQYQEVQKIGSRAIIAEQLLKAEMQKRMEAAKKQPVSQPTPTPQAQSTPEPAVKQGIDLGSMANLQFGVSPSSKAEEVDEGYEHDEEIAKATVRPENMSDYDVEY